MVEINAKKGIGVPVTSSVDADSNTLFIDEIDNSMKIKDYSGSVSVIATGSSVPAYESLQTTVYENTLGITRLNAEVCLVDIPHTFIDADIYVVDKGYNQTIVSTAPNTMVWKSDVYDTRITCAVVGLDQQLLSGKCISATYYEQNLSDGVELNVIANMVFTQGCCEELTWGGICVTPCIRCDGDPECIYNCINTTADPATRCGQTCQVSSFTACPTCFTPNDYAVIKVKLDNLSPQIYGRCGDSCQIFRENFCFPGLTLSREINPDLTLCQVWNYYCNVEIDYIKTGACAYDVYCNSQCVGNTTLDGWTHGWDTCEWFFQNGCDASQIQNFFISIKGYNSIDPYYQSLSSLANCDVYTVNCIAGTIVVDNNMCQTQSVQLNNTCTYICGYTYLFNANNCFSETMCVCDTANCWTPDWANLDKYSINPDLRVIGFAYLNCSCPTVACSYMCYALKDLFLVEYWECCEVFPASVYTPCYVQGDCLSPVIKFCKTTGTTFDIYVNDVCVCQCDMSGVALSFTANLCGCVFRGQSRFAYCSCYDIGINVTTCCYYAQEQLYVCQRDWGALVDGSYYFPTCLVNVSNTLKYDVYDCNGVAIETDLNANTFNAHTTCCCAIYPVLKVDTCSGGLGYTKLSAYAWSIDTV